jgi:hypothetical protein
MPPYDLINAEQEILALGIGLGLTVLVILARGSRLFTWSFGKRSLDESSGHVREFAGKVSESDGPVPLSIWLVAATVLVWSVAYILMSGAHGL